MQTFICSTENARIDKEDSFNTRYGTVETVYLVTHGMTQKEFECDELEQAMNYYRQVK